MKKLFALSTIVLSPVLALAQAAPTAGTWGGDTYFTGIVETLTAVVNGLIPVAIGIGFLAFFYYLFQFITAEAADKSKAKSGLVWSVIAIVIMISIYGLASFVRGIFGVGAGTSADQEIPSITI